MVFKQMIEVYDLLDDINASGKRVAEYLYSIKDDAEIEVKEIYGDKGKTDLIKITIPGTNGRRQGGDAPTLGLIGRLGGLGARPERIGFVSDGDGALTVLTCKAFGYAEKGGCLRWRRSGSDTYLRRCTDGTS